MVDINFDHAEKQIVDMISDCARTGTWVLICPIQYPQYSWKLIETLKRMDKNKEIHEEFRLIYDLQGQMQSEIPDSFLFERCITFHLGPQNFDQMPTFDDVWSKVLEPDYMNAFMNTVDGRQHLRANAALNVGSYEVDNVTSLFSKRIHDQTKIDTFKAYLGAKRQDYERRIKQDETKSSQSQLSSGKFGENSVRTEMPQVNAGKPREPSPNNQKADKQNEL